MKRPPAGSSPPEEGGLAWLSDIPFDGAWYPIANTAQLNDVDEGANGGSTIESAIIAQWNGFGANSTGKIWVSLASGHEQNNNQGWQNFTASINLNVDVPAWTLEHVGTSRTWLEAWPFPYNPVDPENPTTTERFRGALGGNHYPASLASSQAGLRDGLPVGRHTYHSQVVIESTNRLMTFSGYAQAGIDYSLFGRSMKVDGYDIVNHLYDPPDTYTDVPGSAQGNPATVARHPDSENVYWCNSGPLFRRWNKADGTWTSLTITGLTSPDKRFIYYKGSLIDAVRSKWVGISLSTDLVSIDVSNESASSLAGTWVALSIPQTTTYADYSDLVHDLDNDRYIWLGGQSNTNTAPTGTLTTCYAITPDTGVMTAINTVLSPINGCQNRMHYFSNLGVIAYVPNFFSNVLVMRTR
jgi:hypothetical protein